MAIHKNSILRFKVVLIVVSLLITFNHKNKAQSAIQPINAPYFGTCIIKRAFEIHQMNCEIQPNNIAVIYQR